jgi:hypothetical protein
VWLGATFSEPRHFEIQSPVPRLNRTPKANLTAIVDASRTTRISRGLPEGKVWAAEVLGFIGVAITGDLWGKKRPPAACVEICPLLVAAMKRDELTGGSINDVKIRFKDSAAKSLALMRQGWDARSGGRFAQVDPKLFNELEPDEVKRNEQIDALTKWYEDNRDNLVWDSKARKLNVKAANLK